LVDRPQRYTEQAFTNGRGFRHSGFPSASNEYTDPASVNHTKVKFLNARWHETHAFTCFPFPTFSEQEILPCGGAPRRLRSDYRGP
jgi:hypothetical protein